MENLNMFLIMTLCNDSTSSPTVTRVAATLTLAQAFALGRCDASGETP